VRKADKEFRAVSLERMVLVCRAEMHDTGRQRAAENIAHKLHW
jgi:hypothetical protein